jgi:hypothetical protein
VLNSTRLRAMSNGKKLGTGVVELSVGASDHVVAGLARNHDHMILPTFLHSFAMVLGWLLHSWLTYDPSTRSFL